jgi:hypothetical protein
VTVNPVVESLTLFKNGTGFFTSKVTLPEEATSITLGPLPAPSHGTFWLSYDKDVPVKSVVTSVREVREHRSLRSVGDLLTASVGKQVSLHISGDAKTAVTGKLLAVTTPQPANAYVIGDGWDDSAQPLAMVRTGEGVAAVPVSSVRFCSVESGDDATLEPLVKRPTMRLELSGPAGGKDVRMSYLARGVTWAPAYHVDISDAKTAKFSAQAVIVNEAAELRGVSVQLATGFPNMTLADVASPIAGSQSLAQFLAALTGNRGRVIASSIDNRSQTGQLVFNNSNIVVASDAGAVGFGKIEQGKEAEDLFLYPLKSLTLSRGETAMVPLFTAEMPYQHVYTWEIGDAMDDDDRYGYGRRGDAPKQEEVWHACRLTNTAKMPLTTAPAEFVKDGQIVGQDTCYYTNAGAATTIRINRALKIAAEQAEEETARTANAAHWFGDHFDKVDVKGTLRLRSGLNAAADVEITKILSGTLAKTEGEPAVTTMIKGLRAVNPKQKLVWKVKLEPGKDVTLEYRYSVLVRR